MTSELSGELQPVLIGGYEEVRAALRNPDLKTTGNAVECGQHRPLLPLQAEGPIHRRVRGRLDALIGRHSPLPLETMVRDHAVALISELDMGVPVDVRDRYSCRLAARVLGSLLGLTDSEVVRVRELSETIMGQHGLVGSVPAPPDIGDTVYAFLDPVVKRAADPEAAPLVSGLFAREGDDPPLDEEEVIDVCYLLVVAAQDTMSIGLTAALGVLAGALAGELVAAIEQDREKPVIEELLRWSSPARVVSRVASDDVADGTHTIKEGAQVLCMLAQANRDSVYANPEEFDPSVSTPPSPPHLAFGAGPHRCVGAHLAHIQIRVTLEEFARRFELTALADGNEPTDGLGLPGEQLVVVLRPRGSRADGDHLEQGFMSRLKRAVGPRNGRGGRTTRV